MSYYDQPGRGTRARDDGGVLLTQGIHTLDLLLSFAGEAAEVKGFSTTTPVHRMETEDLVCAAVRWRSGALGTVQATTAAYPGFSEKIELTGTLGSAVLQGTELQMRLADFLDAIEHGRKPRVDGAEALKVHRFIDALLQSRRSGG